MGVYKDEKRKSYYVSYSYRDPFSGAKRHVTKRGFRTKKEASEWELRSRLQNPIARDTDKLSFEEVARQWELSVQASKEVEKKHQQHFQKRFSEFKDRAIQSISKADLMEWRNELARTDIYSTRTKNTTIAYVKGVFRYANEVYNYPNTASVLYSVKETNAEVMEEMEVWTPHRFGGANMRPRGDNCDYGTLLLFPMTFDGNALYIRYANNTIYNGKVLA